MPWNHLFARWLEADELANAAERLMSDAWTRVAEGKGLAPTDVNLEISRGLRRTASRRLRAASNALELLIDHPG
jgi:hypothetical protein